MSWLEDTLRDFGARLGLSGLEFRDGRFAQLSLGNGGMLGFEHAGAEVLVYQSRPLDYDMAASLEAALAACDARDQPAYVLQAGLRGERELVLLARLPERQFTVPALEQVMDTLARAHERVRNAR